MKATNHRAQRRTLVDSWYSASSNSLFPPILKFYIESRGWLKWEVPVKSEIWHPSGHPSEASSSFERLPRYPSENSSLCLYYNYRLGVLSESKFSK